MKVVQLCNFDRPEAGAFVPMIRSLLLEARERGHHVEAAFLEGSRNTQWIADFAAEDIPVKFAPGHGKVDLTRWVRSVHLAGDEPTVLHTHFTTFDVPAALAARGRPDTAVFWHVHSTLQADLRARTRNVVKFGTLGRRVEAILCPAENIAADVRKRLGPAERVHFFPSALDVGAYPTQTAEDRLAARKELGLPLDDLIVLHFGWHWHLKGGDIFLATMAEMRSRGGERKVFGLERGGGEVGQREAEAAGLDDVVRVIPPVEDIRTLFAAADVVLSSSRSEGMAYSVLEALCSGAPVVATRIPGHTFIARYVRDCRISSRDPSDLADHVEALADREPGEAARDALQAREWIDRNLGLDVLAKKLVDNYEGALRGHAGNWVFPEPRGGGSGSAGTDAVAGPPRRLIHLAGYTSPQTGSFVPMMIDVLSSAAEAGWSVEAVLPDAGGLRQPWLRDFEEAGIPVRFAPGGGRPAVGRWLEAVLDESAVPTILHTHFTEFDVPAVLASWRRPDTQVYWHTHTALSNRPATVGRNVVKFGVLGRAVERILCPSEDLADALQRRRAPAGRVQFFPNAIDVERFPLPGPGDRERARERLGVAPDATVLLSLAWKFHLKGGDRFERVIEKARKDRPQDKVTGVLVTDAPEAAELARGLGLGDSLILLSPQDSINWLYAAADVFVAASRAEGGTPFAVMEALASGLPVVASDIPGHRFIGGDLGNCRISPGEIGELAAAAMAMVDRGNDESVAERARGSIAERFSLAAWTGRLLSLYEQDLGPLLQQTSTGPDQGETGA